MKILKILGLIVGLAVIGFLIAGLFMKKDFHFERSMEIHAPNDVVWNNVLMFQNHEKWSQWKAKDPNMKVEISGTDGTVGAKMSWKSDVKGVGNGSQTITAVEPGRRVDTELDFDGQGKANAYMLVEGDSTACKATWGMDMHQGYPMNAVVALFMSEKVMNDMFDTGLNMLKASSEKK
jgi:uncharacterized protein YndB with AHSA1/START domain